MVRLWRPQHNLSKVSRESGFRRWASEHSVTDSSVTHDGLDVLAALGNEAIGAALSDESPRGPHPQRHRSPLSSGHRGSGQHDGAPFPGLAVLSPRAAAGLPSSNTAAHEQNGGREGHGSEPSAGEDELLLSESTAYLPVLPSDFFSNSETESICSAGSLW